MITEAKTGKFKSKAETMMAYNENAFKNFDE